MTDLVRRSPALAPARRTLSAFAPLTRPVLVRGELATVLALLPDVTGDREPVIEVACFAAGDSEQMLTTALEPHRRALTRGGVLVLLEIDRLADRDRGHLDALSRQSNLDARGTLLAARLICQTDPRAQQGSIVVTPGAYLEIDVPPLRERPDDAVFMVEALLHERFGSSCQLTAQAREALSAHQWAADASEIVALIEKLEARKAQGELPPQASPQDLGLAPPNEIRARARTRTGAGRTLRELTDEFESEVIREAMERLKSNKSQVAKELGISRSYLIQKCNQYKIE